MKNKRQKCIIVLGMHRSGTSIVAGMMSKLGVDMGRDKLSANWGNPTGHYEDKEFLQMNKRILDIAGGGWANPPEIEDILSAGKQLNDEVSSLITRKHPTYWGWKDPRTSLTLPVYLPFLSEYHIVICTRKNDQIAKSLERRSGIETVRAKALSKYYYRMIDRFVDTESACYVEFDKSTKYPKRVARSVAQHIGIDASSEDIARAASIVRPTLTIRIKSYLMRASQLIKIGFNRLLSM